MTLAQQMFAIAPATGKANLSADQRTLLVGKARWLCDLADEGFGVVPTIAITRAAWEGLQAERQGASSSLRTHWVATLFRLVTRVGTAPTLVVRTSAPHHMAGLMPAKSGIAAPRNELESVDTARPLARAIKHAFDSYRYSSASWEDAGKAGQDSQIVIVQVMAEGAIREFLTRDTLTGLLGPAATAGLPLPPLPPQCATLCEVLDRLAGQHMHVSLAVRGDALQVVSARPLQVGAGAELEAATDRVARGIWSARQAVERTDPAGIAQLLHPRLKSDHHAQVIATGLGVSPGAATGIITFTAEDAARWRARGKHCILVVAETGPGDIEGMKAATGILTARGGMTSHAGVVARITGKPCVAGVRTLQVNMADMTCRIGERLFHAGDRITIDGTDGNIFVGMLPLAQPHIGGAIGTLLDWSDEGRSIKVRTNVETVEAARTALSFGAEGIGLARSEHMFFSPERLVALRRMILSENEDDRAKALTGLVDFQTGDYAALFAAMKGRPVTVRLFDPPLHEFLPRSEEDIVETANSLGLDVRALHLRLDRIAEINPMLGHRGVRLAVTYPEILAMQVQAIIAGMRAAAREQAEPVQVEVMVPFVSTAREVVWIRDRVMAEADRAGLTAVEKANFSFGTMIELPRAAIRAAEIAHVVDFFSFGTNDLTQTTFGLSRDDAPVFLTAYQRKGLYDHDPFVTIDTKGVGELIAMAIERGRSVNPKLKVGICGEHAGDPESLAFFATLGIDYVSCSPYRVPVARLALAQALNAAAS